MVRMTTYFSKAEVCKRLDVADPKTLKAWCQLATPPVQARKRKSYGNVQWFTEHELRQLERIAELHGRRVRKLEDRSEEEKGPLPGDPGQEEEEGQDLLEVLSSLEKGLKRAEQQIKALQRTFQGVFGELEGGESLQAFLQAYLNRELEAMRKELENSIIERLTRSEFFSNTTSSRDGSSRRGDERNADLSGGGKRRASYVPRGQTKPHYVPSDLPAGTVTVRTFSERHGTTRDMMGGAIKRGELQAILRPYGGDPERTQPFFSPEQQDAAVAFLEKRLLAVRHCPDCPHAPHE